jgi:hypothetical protein
MPAKSAITAPSGGPSAPSRRAAASASRHATSVSTASCWPMDGTSGRERSVLIFQYDRLAPPPGDQTKRWVATASSRAQTANPGRSVKRATWQSAWIQRVR